MPAKDTNDVIASCAAAAGDAAAVFAGYMLAAWMRFDSGLLRLFHDPPPAHIYSMYAQGAAAATLAALLVFRWLELYVRPQTGSFAEKIPRLLRATLLAVLAAIVMAFAVRTEPPFSRLVILLAVPAIFILLLAERYTLFRWEIASAGRRAVENSVLIVGTGPTAARLMNLLNGEPRLHSRVVGFVSAEKSGDPVEAAIPAGMLLGTPDDLENIVKTRGIGRVIYAGSGLDHNRIIDMMLVCEKNMVVFNAVPDLFQVMTGGMNMQMIDDIPLLGAGRWPLDKFWNRVLKRGEDVIGAAFGLVICAIPFAAIAFLVRRDSNGPVFYRQERCGEGGKIFAMYKFRTMRVDAETGDEPGWTTENDPRRTRVGAFLRKWNLDELPQLWNVLRGDMSLIGPRPERPYFVEQFKEDIRGYMRRHACKPGMTGWAQVNGLRGNSDLRERVKYDLYYLENWAPAFDFKILAKTLFARKNAY